MALIGKFVLFLRDRLWGVLCYFAYVSSFRKNYYFQHTSPIRLQIVPNKQLETLEIGFIKLKVTKTNPKAEKSCLNEKDNDGTIRILRNIASGLEDRKQLQQTKTQENSEKGDS